ncbi:hypothetical protein [Acidicapsa ligni]|uniref:hypothetical protein n=1 Tax=Acidicapsa ligni TaxID=542300 RepID=UPI0021DFB0D3|nr:hypothetical protein [Acidicapsa ligni]
MKKRSLVICALAALVTAGVLAGCGSNLYFAGRVLPPSGIANRVLIAIQNPSPASRGALQFVDAFYDIRQSFKDTIPFFSIAGYSGALPITIQNMPEEQLGAVYGSGDGTFTLINYAKETTSGPAATLSSLSSSIFVSRNQLFVFAASQQTHVMTVVDSAAGKQYSLSLPGVYRVSTNPGGSMALAFVQNSNFVYYPRKLQTSESTSLAAYFLTNHSWPQPYVDCEPQNLPGMCLAQMQSPDSLNTNSNLFAGAPLSFDRPVKALFSADGSSAYILNCGPECGGTASSVSIVPIAPMILQSGQQSGQLPTQSALTKATILAPGGASNGLVNSNMLYVMGQQPQTQADGQVLYAGNLTQINLTNNSLAGQAISVSDGAPGQPTKMILADDNTLWVGTTRCSEGVRFAQGLPYGCLTMLTTSSDPGTPPTVTMIEPFQGDLTGIAAVTTLHKIYIAEGGQVYIYSTTDGSAINNFFVTVNGTAFDVAYMDAITDSDNTDY